MLFFRNSNLLRERSLLFVDTFISEPDLQAQNDRKRSGTGNDYEEVGDGGGESIE